MLSLWACGKDDIQPEDPAPTTCEHSYADATCTAPKTCTKCGATEGDPAGHTLTAVCAACGQTNAGFVALEDASWVGKAEADGSLTVTTFYFYEEDGTRGVQIGYNQYKKLEVLAQEEGRTAEEIRAEYEEMEMLYEFDGVEYVYDGWGMDNWSGRTYTEENGTVTVEFLSLDWNDADEEVWTVEKTAVLTRTGMDELTVTGGDYGSLGLVLTAEEETEDFEYTICDGEVTILNVLTTESNVVVPATIEGCPVTVIGENAFYQKANCVSVELPDSLRRIENGAFYRCSNLQRICIPAGVTFVGDDAFFRTGSLERIEVQTGNAAYCAVDGVLFSANKTTLVCYPEGRTATEYIVPEEVLTIGADAFGYHPLVRRIVIPNTVVNFPEGPLAAITEELTIVGERDSPAEAYAQKWEIAFE
ncbi:MAG: leucine-rich repeat domain-containing protein [Ruminococcaceae bacterium]|nr:leucine-rich repeat domain-containing protein [Oscillospiraceae bacterium]